MTLKTPAQKAEEIAKKVWQDGRDIMRYEKRLSDAITTVLTNLQTQHEAEITELRKAIRDVAVKYYDGLPDDKKHIAKLSFHLLYAFDETRKKQVKRKDV